MKKTKMIGLMLATVMGIVMLTGCGESDESLSKKAYNRIRPDAMNAVHYRTERTAAYNGEEEEIAPTEVWYVDAENWAYKVTWPEIDTEELVVKTNGEILEKWNDTEWTRLEENMVMPPISGNSQPEWEELEMTLVSHEKKDDLYSITWNKEIDLDGSGNMTTATWTFTFNERNELVLWETQSEMPIEAEIEMEALMKGKTQYFSFDTQEVQKDIDAMYAQATKES